MITLNNRTPIADVARTLVLSEVQFGLRFYAGVNSGGSYLLLSLLACNKSGYSTVLREWIEQLPASTGLGLAIAQLVRRDASRDDLADLVECNLAELAEMPELIRSHLPCLIRAGGVL